MERGEFPDHIVEQLHVTGVRVQGGAFVLTLGGGCGHAGTEIACGSERLSHFGVSDPSEIRGAVDVVRGSDGELIHVGPHGSPIPATLDQSAPLPNKVIALVRGFLRRWGRG